MELAGKVVFITGGGGGIGGGMAEAFADKGARIVLADVSAEYVREKAECLPSQVAVEQVTLDVTSLESWRKAREQVEARFGGVDILCNNAGISARFMPLVDMAPDAFERVMAVNVTGVFNGVKTFAAGMMARGSGHIVNTSSINGLLANPTSATYSASKFAVTALSDALRWELELAGVGVSTLFPGLTRSRMTERDIDRPGTIDVDRAAQLRSAMMDPLLVGNAVVRAVELNLPYIVTHPEFRKHLVAHMDEVLAAFDPDNMLKC